ncbi:MAG: permease [Pseudomonadota bacterium]
MTDTTAPSPSARRSPLAHIASVVPDMPLVAWMIAAAVALGIFGGMEADALVSTFNAGFGRALGEFALILLPSFALAAALSRRGIASVGAERATAAVAPLAGAGMICPDTAYAALAPAAGRRKLDVAFGAYAGFKLAYPAGPLIVATGLGAAASDVSAATLGLAGLAFLIPVWAAGVLWGRLVAAPGEPMESEAPEQTNGDRRLLRAFAPFALLASLLALGAVVGPTGAPAIDLLFLPKGALLAAAVLALLQTPSSERRGCLDSAVRRTASLLLVIGAASAFGAVLTGLVPLGALAPQGSGGLALLGLFGLTVAFKVAQGSSMATFAAVAPVAAPIVAASGVDPTAAVFAICAGSFIAILPNDSFYWLVRRDALKNEASEARAIWVLTGGAVAQAAVGLSLVLATVWIMR